MLDTKSYETDLKPLFNPDIKSEESLALSDDDDDEKKSKKGVKFNLADEKDS